MKKFIIIGSIVLIVIIVALIAIFMGNSSVKTAEYDVYKMISDIGDIKNIEVTRVTYPNDDSNLVYSKKDDMVKIVKKEAGKEIVTIIKDNDLIGYDLEDKKGSKVSDSGINISQYGSYAIDFTNLVNYKEQLKYNIENDKINNEKCIKVTFTEVSNNQIYCVLWFNLDSNLIVKSQTGSDSSKYNMYTNIKQNSLSDSVFDVPSDIDIVEK